MNPQRPLAYKAKSVVHSKTFSANAWLRCSGPTCVIVFTPNACNSRQFRASRASKETWQDKEHTPRVQKASPSAVSIRAADERQETNDELLLEQSKISASSRDFLPFPSCTQMAAMVGGAALCDSKVKVGLARAHAENKTMPGWSISQTLPPRPGLPKIPARSRTPPSTLPLMYGPTGDRAPSRGRSRPPRGCQRGWLFSRPQRG